MTVLAPVVVALSASCAGAGVPAAGTPATPAPDTRLTLAIGEVADVPGTNLRVRLDDVAVDSRCPKGEQCVRAGEAVVLISLLADARTTAHRLCLPGPLNEACDSETCVELVQLDPYPRSGHAIEKSDYRATLKGRTGDQMRNSEFGVRNSECGTVAESAFARPAFRSTSGFRTPNSEFIPDSAFRIPNGASSAFRWWRR